jgi:hypothetical protein
MLGAAPPAVDSRRAKRNGYVRRNGDMAEPGVLILMNQVLREMVNIWQTAPRRPGRVSGLRMDRNTCHGKTFAEIAPSPINYNLNEFLETL